jgi:hypothetical protein
MEGNDAYPLTKLFSYESKKRKSRSSRKWREQRNI